MDCLTYIQLGLRKSLLQLRTSCSVEGHLITSVFISFRTLLIIYKLTFSSFVVHLMNLYWLIWLLLHLVLLSIEIRFRDFMNLFFCSKKSGLTAFWSNSLCLGTSEKWGLTYLQIPEHCKCGNVWMSLYIMNFVTLIEYGLQSCTTISTANHLFPSEPV